MIDNDIIKAFENMLKNFDGKVSDFEAIASAIDLINRQKAEFERLRTDYGNMAQHALILIANARAEAVKEFAERLKEHMCEYDLDNYHWFRAIEEDALDDLVKEMVGESK